MRLGQSEAEDILRSGWASLQRGNAGDARSAFERLVEANLANAQVWLMLAQACRAGGDAPAEEAAIDSLLAADPRSLRGLILKGDCRGRAGDTRAATAFYKAALQAAASVGELPPDLAAEMAGVSDLCGRAAEDYSRHLEASLAAAGFPAADRSRRFQESLAILFGEKRIYLQEPTGYYFPRLPQIQFYERSDF